MTFLIDFEIAGLSNLSFDIDHNGEYLYIAAKDSAGDLKVLKMSNDMEQDAEIAHSPSGTICNVACGENSDRIWLAGELGSVGVIKYDGIAGSYWANDSGTTGWNVDTFHLGPDDDELLLVFTDDGKIWESYFFADSPVYWFTLNQNTNFTTYAADRLDTSIGEILIGCSYFYASSVLYTPNFCYDFEDVTGTLADNTAPITSIIFG